MIYTMLFTELMIRSTLAQKKVVETLMAWKATMLYRTE